MRGSTWIRLDSASTKAAAGHAAALDSAMPAQLLTAPLDALPLAWLAQPGRAASFTGLSTGSVPPQLSIMTTQSLGKAQLLVRVQHLFEAGEDQTLSGTRPFSTLIIFLPTTGFKVP